MEPRKIDAERYTLEDYRSLPGFRVALDALFGYMDLSPERGYATGP